MSLVHAMHVLNGLSSSAHWRFKCSAHTSFRACECSGGVGTGLGGVGPPILFFLLAVYAWVVMFHEWLPRFSLDPGIVTVLLLFFPVVAFRLDACGVDLCLSQNPFCCATLNFPHSPFGTDSTADAVHAKQPDHFRSLCAHLRVSTSSQAPGAGAFAFPPPAAPPAALLFPASEAAKVAMKSTAACKNCFRHRIAELYARRAHASPASRRLKVSRAAGTADRKSGPTT